MNRELVISAAKRLLGTRFRHQGRLPDHGIDCVGVLMYCWRAGGIEIRDDYVYGTLPSEDTLKSALKEIADKVSVPMSGDAVTISVGGAFRHVAIVDLRPKEWFFHTSAALRKVVEEPRALCHAIGEYWRPRG